MFDSYSELKQLHEVADILANTSDWPALYDEAQLAQNEVPVYAATYIDDMYVHFDLASSTAAKIKASKQFITNTMYHDALRSKSGEVMRQLFNLRGESNLASNGELSQGFRQKPSENRRKQSSRLIYHKKKNKTIPNLIFT